VTTEIMLDLIGVGAGRSCLDLGCGPGGITAALSKRVGVSGRVTGVDRDPEFLEHARSRAPANVEFRQGDAYAPGLPPASFDLVHMRFLASTAGDPERLLQAAIALCRPSGIVALQEPDVSTLNCYPPHPAWTVLKDLLTEAFRGVGGDVYLAQRLYQLAQHAGLLDVHFRPVLIGVRSIDPMVDYLPATAESLRGTITRLGLSADDELDLALAETRRHLQNADTVFTSYTVAQVWGRKPG
jgi:SAM-dependent methyltransferase